MTRLRNVRRRQWDRWIRRGGLARPRTRLPRAVEANLRRLSEWEPDLSDCAYYRGEGICSYGCHQEPACRTDEPTRGWPSEALAHRRPVRWLNTKGER